jgi:hypothetical protein
VAWGFWSILHRIWKMNFQLNLNRCSWAHRLKTKLMIIFKKWIKICLRLLKVFSLQFNPSNLKNLSVKMRLYPLKIINQIKQQKLIKRRIKKRKSH